MVKLKQERFNIKVGNKKYAIKLSGINKIHPHGIYSVNLWIDNELYLKGSLLGVKNKKILKNEMKKIAIKNIKKYKVKNK